MIRHYARATAIYFAIVLFIPFFVLGHPRDQFREDFTQ